MKTFFNQKTWLYALSLAILSSNATVSIFAQDSNTSTNRKVTGILKNSDKEITISPERSVSQLSKSDAAHYLTNKIYLEQDNSPKPKLGVLLKGSETGAVVLKTFPNTAAAEIGLQENDKIISINGKNIENIASLTEVIQTHKVGDAIVVEYEREGSTKTASSILRVASKDHYLNFRRNYNYNYDYNYNYSNNTRYQKETACEELEKMYGDPFLGVYLSNPHEESGDGARLTSIIQGTGAESALLKADDKITKMDKSPISSSKAAIEFIQSKKPGDKITIQVVRENKTMLIKATLGSWADSPSSTSKIKTLEAYCEANKLEEKDLQENACKKLEEVYGKPFLGAYFSDPKATSGNGARLSAIIKGTGAEAAALKAEDKITKMNETPISCSKEAMLFIQNKQPGDQIKVQVLRNNQNVLIDATLGSWADSPKMASKISKLEAYCEANTAEAEVPAPKKNTSNALMPSFETQAVMEVFPNPTADFVTIKFEGKKAPLAIQVISLNGQSMYTKNIQNFDGNYNDQLDLSQYPSGVYLIHLTQGDQQITQQVVVE